MHATPVYNTRNIVQIYLHDDIRHRGVVRSSISITENLRPHLAKAARSNRLQGNQSSGENYVAKSATVILLAIRSYDCAVATGKEHGVENN